MKSSCCILLTVILTTGLLLAEGAGIADARPVNWTFSGFVEVQDLYGNPLSHVPVRLEGSTRYNIQWQRDPELGGSGAGEAAQVADMGTSDAGDLDDLLHSRCILLWGKGVTTSFVHMLPEIKAARQRSAAVVLIDPAPAKTARFADLVVVPRPGTDRFLALGIAHWLDTHGRIDPTLDAWSVGHESFLALVRSRPFEAWAESADVAPDLLAQVAALYGTRAPANIQVGWGFQRRRLGGVTVRVLDALGALGGHLGVSGGGVTFYYKRRRAFETARWGAPPERRGIPEPLLGQGILDSSDPPVRAVVVDNGNPVGSARQNAKRTCWY